MTPGRRAQMSDRHRAEELADWLPRVPIPSERLIHKVCDLLRTIPKLEREREELLRRFGSRG